MHGNLDLNSNKEKQECNFSGLPSNSNNVEKSECSKRKFDTDTEVEKESELSKLLKEPIKKLIAKIKKNENGVIYVEFEEEIETNKDNDKKDICSDECSKKTDNLLTGDYFF